MDHTESLFIHTLDELAGRIASQDPYEILGASALIRKLLLDEQPLVDQINRKFRLKIAFHVTLPTPTPAGLPDPLIYTVQDGLDPDTAPPFKQRANITRDQFLAYVLIQVRERTYTLREVVLFEAHVMGGVHAGSAKEEKEKALKEINSKIEVGGYRSSLRQLQAIGRVVLKALKPLREAIEAKAM